MRDDSSQSDRVPNVSDSPVVWPSTMPSTIAWPLAEIAITHLLKDYLPGSHFDYVPSLYTMHATDPLLCTVLEVVGLASFSLQIGRQELQVESRKRYVGAINQINRCLDGQETYMDDCTLTSVMLLSLFETIHSHMDSKAEAWSTHVQGALSLVLLRDTAQFESRIGREIFQQVAHSVTVFCVQRRLRIPDRLRKLTLHLARMGETKRPKFGSIIEAFADLRAGIAEATMPDQAEIVTRAEKVLEDLEEFTLQLPLSDKGSTARFPESRIRSEPFMNHCILYKDKSVTQLWNTIWMTRMALRGIIYEATTRQSDLALASSSPSNHLTTLKQRSQDGAIAAALAICASVPPYFPLSPLDVDYPIPQKPCGFAEGYFLIWPLFAAGSNPFLSDANRAYVIGRLESIYEVLKLPQAQRAASLLAEGNMSEDW